MKMAGRGQVTMACLLALCLVVMVTTSVSIAENHSNVTLRSSYRKSAELSLKCKVIYDFKQLEFEDKQKSSNLQHI